MAIDKCPICGAMLTAHVERYMIGAVLTGDGRHVVSFGQDTGETPSLDSARVGCANDHLHREIVDALAKAAATSQEEK